MARVRHAGSPDHDPLYLRVGAVYLGLGCPHDGPDMMRRATRLGLTPQEHRDAALAAEAAHLAGQGERPG